MTHSTRTTAHTRHHTTKASKSVYLSVCLYCCQAATYPRAATCLSAADRVMEDTDENTAEDAVMQLSPAEKDTPTELEGR